MMIATRPIRFLIGVIALWVGARAWLLWPEPPEIAVAAMPEEAPSRRAAAVVPPLLAAPLRPQAARIAPVASPMRRPPAAILADARENAPQIPLAAAAASPPPPGAPTDTGTAATVPPALAALPGAGARWSGSAWAYLRGGGNDPLAAGGQLGASQAGARILFRPVADLPVAIAARISRPIEQKGAEAAIGLDWQPLPIIRLAVERRVRIERGGRDAWSAFAAGGVYDRRVAGLRVDGYAQAGVVGARSRDLFADGALRAGRVIGPVTIGAGAWGAAQPGVARLDIGPQAVLRMPVAGTTISAAADWRFRVAGDARPGDGPALTIGVDF